LGRVPLVKAMLLVHRQLTYPVLARRAISRVIWARLIPVIFSTYLSFDLFLESDSLVLFWERFDLV